MSIIWLYYLWIISIVIDLCILISVLLNKTTVCVRLSCSKRQYLKAPMGVQAFPFLMKARWMRSKRQSAPSCGEESKYLTLPVERLQPVRLVKNISHLKKINSNNDIHITRDCCVARVAFCKCVNTCVCVCVCMGTCIYFNECIQNLMRQH